MSDPVSVRAVLLHGDPLTVGLVCARVVVRGGLLAAGEQLMAATNIPLAVVHHSPDGFEWGYSGSGPADLALNVLALFVPAAADGREPVPCWRGQCSRFAWDHHQELKRDHIAALPREGGRLDADFLRIWIAGRWRDRPGTREPRQDLGVDLADALGDE